MKVKHILVIDVVVLIVFGAAFLFVPVWAMELFGFTLEPAGVLMTRLVAAAFIGFGVLNWIGRHYIAPNDVFALIAGNFTMNIIGFFVTLFARMSGMGNLWTWIPVLLYLLFASAFGYSMVDKSTYEEPTVQMKHA